MSFFSFCLDAKRNKKSRVFEGTFCLGKTAAKSAFHALFRLHRNAIPFDLQLVRKTIQNAN